MVLDSVYRKYGDIEYYLKPIDLNYVNDDEMYEICALVSLEKHGIDVTAKDIAQEWLDRLYTFNFTAELIALKNLTRGIWPPESGINNNFYFDARQSPLVLYASKAYLQPFQSGHV